MKQLSPLFAFLFFAHISFSQTSLVNFKEGTWKNKQSWLYQQIPADTNDVVLMHDIVVDTNAICRSLTTNGYNVTIANGFNLKITGWDTISTVPDNDTLISELTYVYYGDGASNETLDIWYRRYEYDELKRVSKVFENSGDDFLFSEMQYFYNGKSLTPYKSIFFNPCDYQSNGVCITERDTSYYTYNDKGLIVIDSSSSLQTEDKLNYKHTSRYIINDESIIKYTRYNSFVIFNSNGEQIINEIFDYDTTYYNQIIENGNIMKQTDSSAKRTSFHICSYDKKINPLYKASIHLPVLPFEQLLFEGPEQKNNTLVNDEVYTNSGNTRQKTYKSVFKYKPNNYPSEWFLSEGDDNLVILKYKYTK